MKANSKLPAKLLQVTLIVNNGKPGVDDDSSTPIVRAFRALMVEGKPIASAAICYFANRTDATQYWLGVFVLSAGRQIIFFPALDFDSASLEDQAGSRRAFRVDHLTLDRDWRRWHFTQQHPTRNHVGSGFAHPIRGGGVLWFGMTARRANLRELKRETRLTSPVPSSDADRRLGLLEPLLKTNKQQLILLHGAATGDSKSLHFACVIGNVETPDYHGSDLMLPAGSPFLRTPLETEGHRLARWHRIDLDNSVAVQLISVPLQSDLTVPITFTTRATPRIRS